MADAWINGSSYAQRRNAPSHGYAESKSYFASTRRACIVCSPASRRDEVQGTFALTIQGRRIQSKGAASQDQRFSNPSGLLRRGVEACPARVPREVALGLGAAERAVRRPRLLRRRCG